MVTDENTTAVIREEGERCQISIEYFITVFPPDGSVKFSYIKNGYLTLDRGKKWDSQFDSVLSLEM